MNTVHMIVVAAIINRQESPHKLMGFQTRTTAMRSILNEVK
ncbi:MAG: hypothetical protein OJF51_000846 [Nitrospira sp.]|nr:MAG: hypothetical protein OJF51_000846 [Nitrospira sp.]